MKILILGICITLLISCMQKNFQLKHEINTPVRKGLDVAFAKPGPDSLKLFYSYVKRADGLSEQHFVKATHPFAIRAQFWFDKLDAHVRDEDPIGTADVPKPVPMVAMNQKVNAKPIPQLHCFKNIDIGINIDPGFPNIQVKDFEREAVVNKFCSISEGDDVSLMKVLDGKMLNDMGLRCDVSEAKINKTAAGRFQTSIKCKGEYGIQPILLVRGGYMTVTSPYVSINSGVFTSVSEDVFLGILAHELGHYYRSHNTVNMKHGEYNYFYKITGREGSGKPRPLAKDDPDMDKANAYNEAFRELHSLKSQQIKTNAQLQAAEQAVEDAEKELTESRIGHYTIEQEADHLSAEWLHDLGVNPKVFSAFWVSKADEDCKKSFHDNWKDAMGEPITVGVDTVRDRHHSACFRAFSIDADVANHQFEVPTGGYPGLAGIAGYNDLEEKYPYRDARKLVNDFFPENTVDNQITFDEMKAFISRSAARMKKVASGLPFEGLVNLDFAFKSKSCRNTLKTTSSANIINISINDDCLKNVSGAAFNSKVNAKIEWESENCNLGQYDGEILVDVIPVTDPNSCINDSPLIKGRVELGTKVEPQELRQSQFGDANLVFSDKTYKVSSQGNAPVEIVRSGDEVSVSDYEEVFGGSSSILSRIGTSYNTTFRTDLSRILKVTNLRSKNGVVNGEADFEIRPFKGSFEIIDGELVGPKLRHQ